MGETIRTASLHRQTGETDIELTLNLDGTGKTDIDTGIGFFDHMLNNFARHGLFDLTVKAKGDLYVDCHHLVEDTGIVLGQAIKEAVGDKKSIKRYGYSILPMDETLMLCSLDLSGRPYFQSDFTFQGERCGYFDTAMTKEFFYAISYSALMNLHFKMLAGENDHHIIECAFKSFAKSLDVATMVDERITSVLSTKGTL
ncbi:MAG: imidazoleglycerol-phosphate dehydratase HisB [Lachnospiraceae bacterium]